MEQIKISALDFYHTWNMMSRCSVKKNKVCSTCRLRKIYSVTNLVVVTAEGDAWASMTHSGLEGRAALWQKVFVGLKWKCINLSISFMTSTTLGQPQPEAVVHTDDFLY